MCDICLRTPCHSGCPNAPEPTAIYTCDRCSEPILADDKYLEEPDGDYLCENCLDNMTTLELLSELGIEIQTAKDAEAC